MNLAAKYLKELGVIYLLAAVSIPQAVNLTTFSQYKYLMSDNKVRPIVGGSLVALVLITPAILAGIVWLKRASSKLGRHMAVIVASLLIPISFLPLSLGKLPRTPMPSLLVCTLFFTILSGVTLVATSLILGPKESGDVGIRPAEKLQNTGYSYYKLWFIFLTLFCIWGFVLLDNFSGMTSSELVQQFKADVIAEDDYRATLIMKELCTRKPENMSEDGLQILNCTTVVNAYPSQIEFSRDRQPDGQVDWTGVARYKNSR